MRSLLAVILILAATVAAQTPARVAVSAGPPRDLRGIWVLQPDNKLVMYDAVQFRFWQSYGLPAEARKSPEEISISRGHTVIFAYPLDGRTTLRRFWSSNRYGRELIGGGWDRKPAAGGSGYSVLEATPTISFSSDGDKLYWFEYRQQRTDVSRDARFLSWTTDLQGGDPREVAQFTFPSCKCETGACSETCPEAWAWAPPSGVDDFFYVTRWVPGQIGSDYLESAVYQRNGGAWISRKLSHPVERFLDAADHGNIFVEALGDAGCCGWLNDSDDTTSIVRGDSSTTIFDERRRFHNDNYDVSFYTANAAIAPDLDRIAYTVVATHRPGDEIRLSSEGKENVAELDSIKQALTELPRVEVVAFDAPDKPRLSLPHTELIGWLDGQRLLVFTNGELLQVDSSSGKTTATGIKADAAKFVLLR